MVCGLLEAQRSGKGRVVDVAMTDGAALLFRSIAREIEALRQSRAAA